MTVEPLVEQDVAKQRRTMHCFLTVLHAFHYKTYTVMPVWHD
jgi:hypothetical protein